MPAGRVQGSLSHPDPPTAAVPCPADTALALVTGWAGGYFGCSFAGFLAARLLRPSGGYHLPARHPDRRFLSVPRSASL